MKLKKWVVVAAIVLIVFVVGINSCSIVGPTQRGIKLTLGKPTENILEPGLHLKAPFFQTVKKYDITPIQYKKSLGIGEDGALTSDQQTIGVDYELFWKYSPEKIYEVTLKYSNKDIIYERISTPLKEILKDEVSKRSVTELIANLTTVSSAATSRLKDRLKDMPIEIEGMSVVNINWSDDYDKQIKETANRRQQVQIAEQDLAIAKTNAQTQVAEAQAKLEAEKLNAEAAVAKAEGESQARKLAADATEYENRKIAQNLQVMQAQWKHAEEMERLARWNGVSISNQSVYVPNTYDLKDGK